MKKPVKYDPERHPALVAALTAAGKIDTEIAKLLDIERKTIHNWRKKHPEFDQAMREGKEPADEKVEQSLFKRALGFEYERVEMEGDPGPDGKIIPVKLKKSKVVVAPDVTACIFWLKNRRPDKWRDRQEQRIDGELKVATLADAVREIATAAASGAATGASGG